MCFPTIESVIDLGSNSARLEAARLTETGVESLYHDKITCRLIEGMRGKTLAPDAIVRTKDALRVLSQKAQELGAEHVYAFATSAMRDGENRGEILSFAQENGIDMRVLSGTEEAMLAFCAVPKTGRQGVIDIGGGSTEIITGEDGVVRTVFSAQMGAVRLLDMSRGETDAQNLLETVKNVLRKPAEEALLQGERLWTVEGGSGTALGCVLDPAILSYTPERANGFVIRISALREAFHAFLSMTDAQRKSVPGMEIKRSDIIHCSCAILLALMELLQIEEITVSTHDNMIAFLQQLREARLQ